MEFRFEKLIPLPMVELHSGASDIWEAESFYFHPGRKYRVVAPSGKGKTSLLSIMFGLRDDFRGKLLMDNRDTADFSSRDWSDLRKRKLSFIFQGLELFDDLSAMENIRLKNNITKAKTESGIREMANHLGIGPFLERKCGILSFGQKQRVAIIRALCQPFEYLLADECFSHIDHQNSSKALELITRECEDQGAGLILTSLDDEETDHFDEMITL